MTTTPHAELLSDAEIAEIYANNKVNANRYARAIERALLARLEEQQPVARWVQKYPLQLNIEWAPGYVAKAGAKLYAHPPDMTAAVRDVLAERHRQVEVKGFDARHDDENQHEEMAFAAACYVTADEGEAPPALWPWGLQWWKPKGRRTNLVKAAALTIAEIERLDRAGTKEQQT